jgi:GT2 family glycosyltransferase
MNDFMTQPAAIAPFVYLVVLNWNGFQDTHECLLSLRDISYPRYRVLVVDNASSDDSPQCIAEQHPAVELVVCAHNRGIAAGYNRGIQEALARGADYIVVMNNDLVVDPAFLSQMIVVQRAWPGCGIVMPKIFYYEARDTIWSTGGRARWMPSNILLRGRKQKDSPAFQKNMPIEFAPSCCLLLARELCEQVAFDEHYFFYYDDWDFCVEAREAGFQIVFAADAHVWHKVSRSTQNSPKSRRWWKILGTSCARYHRKHHSMALLALYVAWVLLRETLKANLEVLPTFISGVWQGARARTIADIQPVWSDT